MRKLIYLSIIPSKLNNLYYLTLNSKLNFLIKLFILFIVIFCKFLYLENIGCGPA